MKYSIEWYEDRIKGMERGLYRLKDVNAPNIKKNTTDKIELYKSIVKASKANNVVRVNVISIEGHPIEAVESIGMKVLLCEYVPIADCAFMLVDKIIEPIPNFITKSNYKLTV